MVIREATLGCEDQAEAENTVTALRQGHAWELQGKEGKSAELQNRGQTGMT